jgi:hypothetical protein
MPARERVALVACSGKKLAHPALAPLMHEVADVVGGERKGNLYNVTKLPEAS